MKMLYPITLTLLILPQALCAMKSITRIQNDTDQSITVGLISYCMPQEGDLNALDTLYESISHTTDEEDNLSQIMVNPNEEVSLKIALPISSINGDLCVKLIVNGRLVETFTQKTLSGLFEQTKLVIADKPTQTIFMRQDTALPGYPQWGSLELAKALYSGHPTSQEIKLQKFEELLALSTTVSSKLPTISE